MHSRASAPSPAATSSQHCPGRSPPIAPDAAPLASPVCNDAAVVDDDDEELAARAVDILCDATTPVPVVTAAAAVPDADEALPCAASAPASLVAVPALAAPAVAVDPL